jgi:KDO2-lipid IV(A) lauroyltransferase
MTISKQFRRILEHALVQVGRITIQYLPRGAVVRLSRALGTCTYALSARARNIAAANLELAFGDTLSYTEKKTINKESFQSFCLLMLDLFWFNRNTLERINKHVDFDESFQPFFDSPPTILVTAHIGNWEMIGVGSGAKDQMLTSIAMPLKNAAVDKELNTLRTSTGSEIVFRKGAIRNIIKALRNGRSTTVLIDQNTLPEAGGIFIPFFGVPVPISKAIGTLWARTDAQIMVVWCVPDKHGNYTMRACPPIPGTHDTATTDEITVKVTHDLEDIIRKYPQFWLWSYRRWRFFRKEDNQTQYPFYAESYEEFTEYRKLRQQYQDMPVKTEDAQQELTAYRTMRLQTIDAHRNATAGR